MELPHLGQHCSESTCKRLDFLPIKCDACNQIFCNEHYHYTTHNCPNAFTKNNQVPVCPLCNIPIPIPWGQQPDTVVGAHIDTDCQSDPAKTRRKVFVNRCSVKGCKGKEIIPVVCNDCRKNYCLRHRHPTDHKCEGPTGHRSRLVYPDVKIKKENSSGTGSNRNVPLSNQVQGDLTEDEALARALALSMQEPATGRTQEELDLALARQLQASETQTAVGGARNTRDRCNVS